MTAPRNVVLTGFMGTGKSTIGPELARLLGFGFVDTDELIREREGQSIAEIFHTKGEQYFRNLERAVCRELGSAEGLVIATGGGTLILPEIRTLMEACASVVCLHCDPHVIAERLKDKDDLPLLPADERARFIRQVLSERESIYRSFSLGLDTSTLSPADAAYAIAHLVGAGGLEVSAEPPRLRYPIIMRNGLLQDSRAWRQLLPDCRRVVLITDHNVAPLYARPLSNLLQQLDIDAPVIAIPPGETHKNAATLLELLAEMAQLRIDRSSLVMAVGGGVVGDIAALAAGVYMRGLRLIQVPTTLLAMVDASIGGKAAVDHKGVKNLVGCFHHPDRVLIDVSALKTLARSELSNGLAEAIKTALIGDAELFELLESRISRSLDLDLELLEEIVRRCAVVKSAIVSEDPAERDRRRVLNLGHTLGHALEADGGFVQLSHGQAVALGLLCSAWIGRQQGLTAPGLQARLRNVLLKAGLPVNYVVNSQSKLLDYLRLDKKLINGQHTMVLPLRPGQVEIRGGLDDRLLLDSLEAISP